MMETFKKEPVQLMKNVYVIDGLDMNVPNRTGIFVLTEEELTLVGTGPSPSVKHIKAGLLELGYTLQDVKYIILNHANLDHAGGVGILMRECLQAKVVVHPEAVEYLLKPRKVAAITRAMYGDSFTDFFDPIGKVYKEDILVKKTGETLQIGPKCVLEFLDTPGYVTHHFAVYHQNAKAVFTGNVAGVKYDQLSQIGIDLYLPFTPPNQLDPEAMKQSLGLLQDLDIKHIFYGHYGKTDHPKEALHQVNEWLDIFLEEAEEVFFHEGTYEDLTSRLQAKVKNYLRKQGIGDNHEVFLLINLDLYLSSLGLIDYFQNVKH